MPKIEKVEKGPRQVQARTAPSDAERGPFKWWLAKSKKEMAAQVVASLESLRSNQEYRNRQAALFARLYSNIPLFNFVGANLSKMNIAQTLPIDRPTMNVVQSCVDTLTSRITQSKPRPVFLTDNGDYKERGLAEKMNMFVGGELYRMKGYEKAEIMLRDAAVLGTGILKVYEDASHRVALDRVLFTELFVDPNDAWYGEPRQLFQLKLIDKAMLQHAFPEDAGVIKKAEPGFPDESAESKKTIADQVLVVEAWRLPSGKGTGDGKHVIACNAGLILEEEWKSEKFPFVFLHYTPRIAGFWAQGLAEQLMGTQVEINKLLITSSRAINLVGVPRVFMEEGSKVVKAHLNNEIGSIVTYKGTKPIYEVAPCVPQEVYAQLERLVQYAYQQSGISSLAATAQKPAGLNSGEAIRNYDDLQSDRFAALSRRYDNVFIDLAYQIIDLAVDIAKEQGEYETVYPNKDGVKEIKLPDVERFNDPYVIQCFDASSLPREPAGRLEKVVEMMQAGLIDPQEGRRLLDFPDIQQVEKLQNAAEERILKVLDQIVKEGKATPADPYMNLDRAETLAVQYYNLYVPAGLEASRAEMLRTFILNVQTIKAQAMAPDPSMMAPQGAPQAVPAAPPVSPMLPNAPAAPIV